MARIVRVRGSKRARGHLRRILRNRKYQQTGRTHIKQDRYYRALHSGWRPRPGGGWYFENRANRSDKRGYF